MSGGGRKATPVIGAAAPGAYTGTWCNPTVGVGLAFAVDGLGCGLVVARLLVEAPPLLARYAPPPPMSRSSTTAAAAGMSQRGRSEGRSIEGRLGGGLRTRAGAGARGIGGAAVVTAAAAKGGGEVELLTERNSSGTGAGAGVASPVQSDAEMCDSPGVHSEV